MRAASFDRARRSLCNVILAGGVALVVLGPNNAQADGTVNTGYFGGVAIMGYDPVAYFTDGKAVKGSEKYAYDWLGAPWHFASDEHRKMFMSDPVKYAPQYGGYCAGEVSLGSVTVNIDPEAFKIIDGKLYLVYDKPDAEVFAEHSDEILPKAQANWPTVKARLEQDQIN
jgi:YHS domain-containing protein